MTPKNEGVVVPLSDAGWLAPVVACLFSLSCNMASNSGEILTSTSSFMFSRWSFSLIFCFASLVLEYTVVHWGDENQVILLVKT
jgi:hypothetical protein